MQERISVQLDRVGQNEEKVNGKVLTIFSANMLFLRENNLYLYDFNITISYTCLCRSLYERNELYINCK